MKTLVLRFIEQESGATVVADGPIASGIAITGAVDGVGTTLTTISSSLK
jgi:Flp pilus assembly pilin Flp